MRDLVSVETLRSLISYDHVSGDLIWLIRPVYMFKTLRAANSWNTKYAGTPALNNIHKDGYKNGLIFGKYYAAHRVCWALHYGRWPSEQIDHENRNRADNRILNLRDVSNSENQKNVKLQKNNTSGIVGVSRKRKKWAATITVSRKQIHLGYFYNISDAVKARLAAEIEYNYHPTHGK